MSLEETGCGRPSLDHVTGVRVTPSAQDTVPPDWIGCSNFVVPIPLPITAYFTQGWAQLNHWQPTINRVCPFMRGRGSVAFLELLISAFTCIYIYRVGWGAPGGLGEVFASPHIGMNVLVGIYELIADDLVEWGKVSCSPSSKSLPPFAIQPFSKFPGFDPGNFPITQVVPVEDFRNETRRRQRRHEAYGADPWDLQATALEGLQCGGATRGLPRHFKSWNLSMVQERASRARHIQDLTSAWGLVFVIKESSLNRARAWWISSWPLV